MASVKDLDELRVFFRRVLKPGKVGKLPALVGVYSKEKMTLANGKTVPTVQIELREPVLDAEMLKHEIAGRIKAKDPFFHPVWEAVQTKGEPRKDFLKEHEGAVGFTLGMPFSREGHHSQVEPTVFYARLDATGKELVRITTKHIKPQELHFKRLIR